MNTKEYGDIIAEYNDILCGVKTRFSKTASLTETTVREIARFAFEYYLKWTPKDIAERCNGEILEKLKLDSLFKTYVDFPKELNPKVDYFYYAHWIYPNSVSYNIRKGVLKVYRGILNKSRKSFSINFFNDDFALERAEICLQEALTHKEFKDDHELYAFFASEDGAKFIEDYKLGKPLQAFYKNPLIFLHSALPDEYKNSFWFNYYIFKPQFIARLEALAK